MSRGCESLFLHVWVFVCFRVQCFQALSVCRPTSTRTIMRALDIRICGTSIPFSLPNDTDISRPAIKTSPVRVMVNPTFTLLFPSIHPASPLFSFPPPLLSSRKRLLSLSLSSHLLPPLRHPHPLTRPSFPITPYHHHAQKTTHHRATQQDENDGDPNSPYARGEERV